MAHDPRDVLWNAIFETYYDTYYHEYLSEALSSRWQVVDELTKALVAITATGSAIAGWALWTQAGYEGVWAGIAGTAAVLSIVHATLSVADRMKDTGELRRAFGSLRVDLQTCRQRMRIDPDFDVDDFTRKYEEFRRRYGDCEQRIKGDVLRTNRLRQKIQLQVNETLSDEIAK